MLGCIKRLCPHEAKVSDKLMFTPTASEAEEELFTTGRSEVIKASCHLGIRSESLLGHWECTFRGDWIVVFRGFDSCDHTLMYQEPLQAQHCSL